MLFFNLAKQHSFWTQWPDINWRKSGNIYLSLALLKKPYLYCSSSAQTLGNVTPTTVPGAKLRFIPCWKQMHGIQYMWQALIAMRRDFKEPGGVSAHPLLSPPCSESTNSRSVSKLPHHCPRAKAVFFTLSEGCHILSRSLLLSLSLPLVSILFSPLHCLHEIGRYNI